MAIYLGDGKLAESGGGSGSAGWGISSRVLRFKFAYRLTDEALAQISSVNTVIDWGAIGIDYISPADGSVSGSR